jgi:signal peptidase II
MRGLARFTLVSLLLVGCVGCDQISKHVARSELVPAETHSYLNDTVRLILTENTGAFLSLGDSLPESIKTFVFQGAVGLLVLGLLWAAAFARGLGRWQITAFALLAAGGLGNLIDRLLYDGRVTDFLNLGVGSLRTGIFNVADAVAVLGVITYLLGSRAAPVNRQALK